MDLRSLVTRQPAPSLEQTGETGGAPSLTRRRVLAGGGAVLGGLALSHLVASGPGGGALAAAPALPPLVVRQPQPHDIVDDPVAICGIGTGFEGVFGARVRDGNGRQLTTVTIRAGGTGVWGNYHATLPLGGAPATAQGTVEVFGFSGADGSEIGTVRVPVVFGRALIDPYHGFGQHTVARGETLSSIARHYYGASTNLERRRLYEANRHQLSSPDAIYPGQVLRIPQ